MGIKIFDSELKVMETLWKVGNSTAGQLVQAMKKQVGWSRTTTYTVIGKLIDKGAIERYGSDFSCKAIITKEQVQQYEATELIDKLFNGSAGLLMSTLLSGKTVSPEEIERIKRFVDGLT